MALFQPNPNPTARELRWFAGLWFPAFWGAAGVAVWRRGHVDAAAAVWLTAAAIAAAGLAWPQVIRPVFLAMMRATYPLGWVLSHVVVASAYFLIITPVGALMPMRHEPMRRRLDRSARSYWIPCERAGRGRYFRQL